MLPPVRRRLAVGAIGASSWVGGVMGWGCHGLGVSWVGGVAGWGFRGLGVCGSGQCTLGRGSARWECLLTCTTRGDTIPGILSPLILSAHVYAGMGWDGMGYYLGWDGILSAHLYAGMGWDGMGGMGWVGSIYPRVRGDVDRAVHVAVQPVLACSGWESRWESRWE